MEEISWRQKSRALRLREGDCSTKFFYRTTNLCRKFNFMSGLEIEGNCYETIESMKSSIHGFYKKLFSGTEPWRPKVDGLSLPSLSPSAREVLEMQFDEEVIRALHNSCGDKAPGSDGMTTTFLQANWDAVRGDVLTMFSEFYTCGKFVASLNGTFIGLIPKRTDAQNIKDDRPINMIGCVYKSLSKVLARRLRCVIRGLISENQNAFVGAGRIWMQCSLQMSSLTPRPSQVDRGLFVSLTSEGL